MDDKTYNINSWDAQVTADGNTYQVSFLFVPDVDFVEYAKENDGVIQVQISGTDSIYDGRNYIVKVDSTKYGRNCSSNFYDATKMWIATIPISFTNFPPKTGQFKVVTGPFKAYDFKVEKDQAIEGYEAPMMILGDQKVPADYNSALNREVDPPSTPVSRGINVCLYTLIILLLFVLFTRYK